MSKSVQFPKTEFVALSMPEPHVLLITINRPKQYNALHVGANWELHHIFDWAEKEDSVWVIIVRQFIILMHGKFIDLIIDHWQWK